MIITSLLLSITSNSVAEEKSKSMIYCRIIMQALLLTCFILYNNLFIKYLREGLGIYGGIFNVNSFTQSFNLFLIIIVTIILVLTSFSKISVISTLVYSKVSGYAYKTVYIPNKIFYNNESSINPNKNNDKIIQYLEKYSNKLDQLNIIEYALIIMFILSGAILLMSTVDLISMFLSIELQSYGLYILCTLYRDSEYATNSGLTYFLLGGMSSCFILFGSGLIYVNSGTTSIENIYLISSISEFIIINENNVNGIIQYVYNPNYISISLIIIIVGFLFKVSAAPFHFWSPDVYDGIPTIVTTFVATVPKVSIFVLLVQLILGVNYIIEYNIVDITVDDSILHINPYKNMSFISKVIEWKEVIVMSSLASLIIGSLLGLTQHRIKRLFAYSTVSHVGFILLALSIGTVESVQGYIFYIIQYTISNINAFFLLVAIGFILRANNSTDKFMYEKDKSSKNNGGTDRDETYNDESDNIKAKSAIKDELNYKSLTENHMDDTKLLRDTYNSPIQLIDQLKGYFYVNSYICVSLSITLFSFVGIPPLIGFFAKQMVLSSALDNGYVFITLIAVITSVIGAVYYLNIIKSMFFYNIESKSSINLWKTFSSFYKNTSSEFLPAKGNDPKKTYNEQEVYKNTYYVTNVKINSALTTIISILTTVILTFILMPNEWLRIASILSITLFKV